MTKFHVQVVVVARVFVDLVVAARFAGGQKNGMRLKEEKGLDGSKRT